MAVKCNGSNNKMNILFITHYSEFYGANRSLLSLIEGLRKKGVKALVVIPWRGELSSVLDRRGIKYEIVTHHWWCHSLQGNSIKLIIDILLRHYQNAKATFRTVNLVKKNKIDIIYSNSSTVILGYLTSIFTRKPHVWHLREFGSEYDLRFDLGTNLSYRIISKSKAIIANSNSLKKYFQKYTGAKNVFVVYNGILSKRKIRENYQGYSYRKNKDFKFAIFGKINKNKGQKDAVIAFSKLLKIQHKVKLDIVGGGETQEIKDLIKRKKIGNKVNLIGYHANPLFLMKNIDALLMCSKIEAMGRVTAEAMILGKPVIGYDSTGTSELIIHKNNGLLYKNQKQLVFYMDYLIKNPAVAKELGEKAHLFSYSNFSIEDYSTKIYAILEGIKRDA